MTIHDFDEIKTRTCQSRLQGSLTKIVSENDQEIPQSQTADKPESHTTITKHLEDKQSKAPSFFFPSR